MYSHVVKFLESLLGSNNKIYMFNFIYLSIYLHIKLWFLYTKADKQGDNEYLPTLCNKCHGSSIWF